MDDLIEIIEVAADIVIVLGAGWISYLFRRTYKRVGERRSAVLSIIFGALAVYFLIQVLLLDFFNVHSLYWMESHEALEIMLVIMLISLAIILSVGGAWRGAKLEKETRRKPL